MLNSEIILEDNLNYPKVTFFNGSFVRTEQVKCNAGFYCIFRHCFIAVFIDFS